MLRRPLPLLLACVALLAGGVATGCGSSSGSSSAGLTAMVLREALAYVEVTLRPSGAARDDALAAAGKLLNTPARRHGSAGCFSRPSPRPTRR